MIVGGGLELFVLGLMVAAFIRKTPAPAI